MKMINLELWAWSLNLDQGDCAGHVGGAVGSWEEECDTPGVSRQNWYCKVDSVDDNLEKIINSYGVFEDTLKFSLIQLDFKI